MENKIDKEKLIKYLFILTSIIFVIPSVIYLIKNGTVSVFKNYFSWTLQAPKGRKDLFLSTVAFVGIYALLIFLYFQIIKKQKYIFKNVKQIGIFILVISAIFLISLPYTSSDVYYYIGTGWLNAKYNKNPYYITVEEMLQNDVQDDEILQNTGEWCNSTFVYGPAWATITKCLSFLSFGNLTLALYIFKIASLLLHLANCYLIYKLTKKRKMVLLYGLNPFVLIEGLINVHNDLYIAFFILLAIYFLKNKRQYLKFLKTETLNIILSLICLAIATAIKYVAIIIVPFILIYYFKEKEPLKRFIYSIAYGMGYLGIIFLMYFVYIQDISIFLAMTEQVEKYTQSIWTTLQLAIDTNALFKIIKSTTYIMFAVYCVKLVIDMIFREKIKMRNVMQEYTKIMFLLIFLILTNFHQWYLLWLVPAILFTNGKNAKFINIMLLVSELPLITYFWHFSESWRLGYGISICIMILTILVNMVVNLKQNLKKFYK